MFDDNEGEEAVTAPLLQLGGQEGKNWKIPEVDTQLSRAPTDCHLIADHKHYLRSLPFSTLL